MIMEIRICPTCGGERFTCHQYVSHNVVVDGKNNFIDDVDHAYGNCFDPEGPYTCEKCGREFDSLSDEMV